MESWGWLSRSRLRGDQPQAPQPIRDPAESYSHWDVGDLYWTAWVAGLLLILIVLGNLVLALEVLGLL